MKKLLFTLSICLLCNIANASTISLPKTYATNDTVTASNLNGNNNAIVTVVNGSLDNDNADTGNGFRFVEVKGALPAAGTQGRVVFLTTDNTLYFDNSSAFVPVVTTTGTPVQGEIIYYTGTGWAQLAVGTDGQYLQTQGAAANPQWADISDLTIAGQVTGDLLRFDGTNWVRLADGSANQFLESDGAGALTWTDQIQIEDYGTSSSASTTKNQKTLKIAFGQISVNNGATVSITNLPFTSAASYKVTLGNDDGVGNEDIRITTKASGASFSVKNKSGNTGVTDWIAIGF